MKKGIIFDMDGTLLNTLEDIANSCNEVLEEYGYSAYDNDKYKNLVGAGAKTLIENAIDEPLESGKLKQIYTAYRKRYKENCMNNTKPYDGIISLIEKLKQSKMKIGVLSNKPHDMTVKLVNEYFSKDTFDIVYGLKDNMPRKPNPKSLNELLKVLSLKNNEALFVGDTDVDMQTAKNAYVQSIGVLWGFRNKEELLSNGAKYIVSHPEDIIKIVNKI